MKAIIQNNVTDPRWSPLVDRYWEQDARGRWVHTVQPLADVMGVPLHEFTAFIAANSYATHPDWRCDHCGEPRRACSRKQWTERAFSCPCRPALPFAPPPVAQDGDDDEDWDLDSDFDFDFEGAEDRWAWLDQFVEQHAGDGWDINGVQVLVPDARTARQVSFRLGDTGTLCLNSGGQTVCLDRAEQDRLLALLLTRPPQGDA